MKNKLIYTLGIAGFAFTVFLMFTFSSTDNTVEKKDKIPDEYAIHMVPLPENIDFAGEKVPMENYDIREKLDREIHVNTYWHSQTIFFFKRANRYFPVIEKILKEQNVPDDFKYLALIESGLMNVISPAGATGFWQFLEGTARDYGLTVNDEIDERYHLEKSTEAACKYLNESYEKYGTWTMVAASYNFGRRNLDNQIERQKTDYYYDLLLGEETERYLFRILAAKYILQEPERYGFIFTKKDLYKPIPHYYVKVDSSVEDFADFAYGYSVNYKMLKYLNPWLRESYLINPEGKEYMIKIPRKGFRKYNKDAVITPDNGE